MFKKIRLILMFGNVKPIRLFSLFFFLPLPLFALELKIASYNVENLFDMHTNGTEYKEYTPHKHNWTYVNFRKKLLHVSEVICDINADIIGLQEIENENVLGELQKTLAYVGCGYEYFSISHKKKSAIQVAILSKIPITHAHDIVVHDALKYRNILEVKYMIEGFPLYIYVNHWTSKRSAESDRIICAKALKKHLSTLPTGSEYLLLGDFNSDYDEYKHI